MSLVTGREAATVRLPNHLVQLCKDTSNSFEILAQITQNSRLNHCDTQIYDFFIYSLFVYLLVFAKHHGHYQLFQ